jgi:hypothetical protein
MTTTYKATISGPGMIEYALLDNGSKIEITRDGTTFALFGERAARIRECMPGVDPAFDSMNLAEKVDEELKEEGYLVADDDGNLITEAELAELQNEQCWQRDHESGLRSVSRYI